MRSHSCLRRNALRTAMHKARIQPASQHFAKDLEHISICELETARAAQVLAGRCTSRNNSYVSAFNTLPDNTFGVNVAVAASTRIWTFMPGCFRRRGQPQMLLHEQRIVAVLDFSNGTILLSSKGCDQPPAREDSRGNRSGAARSGLPSSHLFRHV